MGKINKNANIYDTGGNLIREAPIKPYTIQELEELIDSLPPGKGREAATWRLFELYNKYGNPHEEDLIKKIKESINKPVDESEIRRALDELRESIETDEATASGTEEKEVPEDVQHSEEVSGYDVNSMDTEYVEPITEEGDDTRKS